MKRSAGSSQRNWLQEQSARARAETRALERALAQTEGEAGGELVRCQLMIDGWEFVRMGHQILANTGAAPGTHRHNEEARHAAERASNLAAIVEGLQAMCSRERRQA